MICLCYSCFHFIPINNHNHSDIIMLILEVFGSSKTSRIVSTPIAHIICVINDIISETTV